MKKAEQSLQGKTDMTGTKIRRRASVRSLWSALVPAAIICALVLSGCKAGQDEKQPEETRADVTVALETEDQTGAPGTSGTDAVESQKPEDGTDMTQSDVPESEQGTDADADREIIPDSDKRFVAWEDVKDLTAEQIRFARNEIYARHGRGFKSQDLQAYFDARSWYKKTAEPDEFSESLLNEYEKWNIRYLKDLEPMDALKDMPEAPSKKVIDQYGYDEAGYSMLSFQLKPGTVKDCGEYYQVDAVFGQGIEAPGDLSYGDRVTLVFNELTGESKTLEYREGGLYPVNEGQYAAQYYYSPSEDGSPVVLYQDSDDRVDKPVYEGKLYVRKDATDEMDIIGQSDPVTLENLNGDYNWYNGVYFDIKGYAVRLIFYGD